MHLSKLVGGSREQKRGGEGVLSTHGAFLASLRKQDGIRSMRMCMKPKASGRENFHPDGPRIPSRPCSISGVPCHCHPSEIRAPGVCWDGNGESRQKFAQEVVRRRRKEATAAAKKSQDGSKPAFERRKHGKTHIFIKGDLWNHVVYRELSSLVLAKQSIHTALRPLVSQRPQRDVEGQFLLAGASRANALSSSSISCITPRSATAQERVSLR